MVSFEQFFMLLRTLVYLLTTVETIALAHLYYVGYTYQKKTLVIFYLQRILVIMAITQTILSFNPIIRYLEHRDLDFSSFLIFLLNIPYFYYLRKFRKESIRAERAPLPDIQQ